MQRAGLPGGPDPLSFPPGSHGFPLPPPALPRVEISPAVLAEQMYPQQPGQRLAVATLGRAGGAAVLASACTAQGRWCLGCGAPPCKELDVYERGN